MFQSFGDSDQSLAILRCTQTCPEENKREAKIHIKLISNVMSRNIGSLFASLKYTNKTWCCIQSECKKEFSADFDVCDLIYMVFSRLNITESSERFFTAGTLVSKCTCTTFKLQIFLYI